MGVSGIISSRVEMMQRKGDMLHANVRAQFFYGPTGQVRSGAQLG
jgi:hypothetical protein